MKSKRFDILGGGSAGLLISILPERQFARLCGKTWVSGNRVMLSDAGHTAHFSVWPYRLRPPALSLASVHG